MFAVCLFLNMFIDFLLPLPKKKKKKNGGIRTHYLQICKDWSCPSILPQAVSSNFDSKW